MLEVSIHCIRNIYCVKVCFWLEVNKHKYINFLHLFIVFIFSNIWLFKFLNLIVVIISLFCQTFSAIFTFYFVSATTQTPCTSKYMSCLFTHKTAHAWDLACMYLTDRMFCLYFKKKTAWPIQCLVVFINYILFVCGFFLADYPYPTTNPCLTVGRTVDRFPYPYSTSLFIQCDLQNGMYITHCPPGQILWLLLSW